MTKKRDGLGVVHGANDISRPNAIRLFGGKSRRGENGLTASGAATVLELTDELTSGDVQPVPLTTGLRYGETITLGIGNDRLLGGVGADMLNAN
jgi:hypothetical protein